MTKDAEKILKQAIELPPADRAAVAEGLISSLEAEAEEDVEVAWQEECARRLREVQTGAVQLVPWETIRARLRNRARDTG